MKRKMNQDKNSLIIKVQREKEKLVALAHNKVIRAR